MRETATRLEEFYASPLGAAAREMAARRLASLWPDLSGQNVLGYGYAWPYLAPYEAGTNRLVLAMPEGQGAIAHEGRRGVSTVLTQGQALPFSDASFDRILAIHGSVRQFGHVFLDWCLWKLSSAFMRHLMSVTLKKSRGQNLRVFRL